MDLRSQWRDDANDLPQILDLDSVATGNYEKKKIDHFLHDFCSFGTTTDISTCRRVATQLIADSDFVTYEL